MSARRLAIPPIILAIGAIAAIYGWAVVLVTPGNPGSIGLNLNALGTDYMPLYGAAQQVLGGHFDGLYDGDRLTAHLNDAFASWLSAPLAYRPWVYPPSYLFVMLPFAAVPFAASYAAFQLATAALLGVALWFAVGRDTARPLVVAAALLGPAAAISVGLGQNAFLAVALLVAGLRLLPRRPVLAGIVLGLLTLKPQNWILVPLALAAARDWRALVASIATGALLVCGAAAAFGGDLWRQWLGAAQLGYEVARLGGLWDDSIYACLLAAGASSTLAGVAQFAGSTLAAGVAYLAFRLPLSRDRKIAVLLAATVVAAPHSSLADLVLPATAAALWLGEAVEEGAPLAQWTLALAVWLAALVNPPLVSPVGRLTPVLLLAFIAFLLGGGARPLVGAESGVKAARPRPLAAGE